MSHSSVKVEYSVEAAGSRQTGRVCHAIGQHFMQFNKYTTNVAKRFFSFGGLRI
jgi:hypothetical protein